MGAQWSPFITCWVNSFTTSTRFSIRKFCFRQVYIHLHDEPYQSKKTVEEVDVTTLSPAELKKYKAKQRKEKKKAAAEERRRQEELAAKRK